MYIRLLLRLMKGIMGVLSLIENKIRRSWNISMIKSRESIIIIVIIIIIL